MEKQRDIKIEYPASVSFIITPVVFITTFLRWWYIDSITGHIRFFKRLIELLYDRTSTELLIKTFFVPWHRDSSIFGVVFGILMRFLYLPLAILVIFLTMIAGFVFISAWLLLPIITIYNLTFFWI